MADEYRDPMLEALTNSEEFQKADAAKKQKVLLAYGQATQAQREEFIYGSDQMEGLTLPPAFQVRPLIPKAEGYLQQEGHLHKDISDQERSLELQKGIAQAGLAVGLPIAGSLPGQALRATMPRLGTAAVAAGEGLGNVAANQVIRATEGQPVELGLTDAALLTTPLALRGVGGALKATTGRARGALAGAQTETENALQKYNQRVTDTEVGRLQDMEAADRAAAEQNAANQKTFREETANRAIYNTEEAARVGRANSKADLEYRQRQLDKQHEAERAVYEAKGAAAEQTAKNYEAWVQRRKDLDAEFQAAKDKIDLRTNISNEQKQAQYQNLARKYQESVAQHQEAAGKLRDVTPNIPTEDYEQLYAAVPKDTPVELTGAKRSAQFIVDTVNNQFPSFKDSNLYAKAQGILKQEGPVPFEKAQQLLKDVGALKASAEARDTTMKGLVKNLDKGIYQDVMATGEPGSALQAANKAYSRSRSVGELEDIINKGIMEARSSDNAAQVYGDSIRKGIDRWMKEDPYAKNNFTPEEWKAIRDNIYDYTSVQRLRNAPEAPQLKTADYRLLTKKDAGPEPQPVQPDYSKVDFPSAGAPPEPQRPVYKTPPVQPEEVQPDYSKVRPPLDESAPEPVQPKAGPFPIASAILGKATGGEAANLVTYPGSTIDSAWLRIGGAAIGTLPWATAKVLLGSPRGQQILKNITAGKQTLTPRDVAAATAAARMLAADQGKSDEQ